MMRLQLGILTVTPNALDFMEEHNIDPLALVTRHQSGDWGDVCTQDRQSNNRAVEEGSRILSSYHFPAGDVWIITEADRSVTTMLLPEDY